MTDEEYEGSAVLEKLMERGVLDEFWEAVDSDDFGTAKRLLLDCGIEPSAIRWVIQKMRDADGDH